MPENPPTLYRKPISKRLLPIEYLKALAMLLEQPIPENCEKCFGRGVEKRIIGFSECVWCKGYGVNFLSLPVWMALGRPKQEFWYDYLGTSPDDK